LAFNILIVDIVCCVSSIVCRRRKNLWNESGFLQILSWTNKWNIVRIISYNKSYKNSFI